MKRIYNPLAVLFLIGIALGGCGEAPQPSGIPETKTVSETETQSEEVEVLSEELNMASLQLELQEEEQFGLYRVKVKLDPRYFPPQPWLVERVSGKDSQTLAEGLDRPETDYRFEDRRLNGGRTWTYRLRAGGRTVSKEIEVPLDLEVKKDERFVVPKNPLPTSKGVHAHRWGRVHLAEGAELLTDGKPLHLKIHRLEAEFGSRLAAFADSRKIDKKPDAGDVILDVQDAKGLLFVDLSGAQGAPGAKGKKGAKGAKGAAGRNGRDDNHFFVRDCKRKALPGKKGKPGKLGGQGGTGKNGGRGGNLFFTPDADLKLQFTSVGGQGGKEGPGGEGGPGGDPGRPGNKSRYCPAAKNPPGLQGNKGLTGARGNPGRPGSEGFWCPLGTSAKDCQKLRL